MPNSQTTLTRYRLILTTYLPSVDILYGINVDNKWKCLDYLPPPVVNVVCEQPLKLVYTFGSEVFVYITHLFSASFFFCLAVIDKTAVATFSLSSFFFSSKGAGYP